MKVLGMPKQCSLPLFYCCVIPPDLILAQAKLPTEQIVASVLLLSPTVVQEGLGIAHQCGLSRASSSATPELLPHATNRSNTFINGGSLYSCLKKTH
jgi:hypothetical protein